MDDCTCLPSPYGPPPNPCLHLPRAVPRKRRTWKDSGNKPSFHTLKDPPLEPEQEDRSRFGDDVASPALPKARSIRGVLHSVPVSSQPTPPAAAPRNRMVIGFLKINSHEKLNRVTRYVHEWSCSHVATSARGYHIPGYTRTKPLPVGREAAPTESHA